MAHDRDALFTHKQVESLTRSQKRSSGIAKKTHIMARRDKNRYTEKVVTKERIAVINRILKE